MPDPTGQHVSSSHLVGLRRKYREGGMLVAGYGGTRHAETTLRFAPRLPPGLTTLAFGLLLSGRMLRVKVTATAATYSALDGVPVQLVHHGQQVTVSAGKPVSARSPPHHNSAPDRLNLTGMIRGVPGRQGRDRLLRRVCGYHS
ncbi:hypothetical protein E3T40_00400 [Cryobacterium sp. TMT1-19]|nr:hypothetical protein E3T40_00400 [Cryobacterium sp. TMT1-19]